MLRDDLVIDKSYETSSDLIINLLKFARNEISHGFRPFISKNYQDFINVFNQTIHPIKYLIKNGESKEAFHLMKLIRNKSNFFYANDYAKIKNLYNECIIPEIEDNNPSLTEAYIEELFDPLIFEILLNAIKINKHLKKISLDLCVNDIVKFSNLMDALKRNQSIEALILGFNFYSNTIISNSQFYVAFKGKEFFTNMLEENRTLLYLHFENKNISPDKLPSTFNDQVNRYNTYIKRNQLIALSQSIFCAWNLFSLYKLSVDNPQSILNILHKDILYLLSTFIIHDARYDYKNLIFNSINRNTLGFWNACQSDQQTMYIRDRVHTKFSTVIFNLNFYKFGVLSFKYKGLMTTEFHHFLKNECDANLNMDVVLSPTENIRKFFTGLNIKESDIQNIFEHFHIIESDKLNRNRLI